MRTCQQFLWIAPYMRHANRNSFSVIFSEILDPARNGKAASAFIRQMPEFQCQEPLRYA